MLFGFLRQLRGPLLGAAATALIFGTASAVAGSGVGGVFNLGVVNTVNGQTTLSGNAGGNPQLRVENAATVQNAFGVLGRITAGSPAGQTAGVRGINSGTNANGFGVWGFHQGFGAGVFGETGAGIGVLGRHTGADGDSPGVQGETASAATDAYGVHGLVTAANPGVGSSGVRGTITGAAGFGVSGVNTGMETNAVGVFGRSTGGDGILGRGPSTGGTFLSAASAVYGCGGPTSGAFPCSATPPFGHQDGIGGQFRSSGAEGIGVHSCAGVSCRMTFGIAIGGEFSAFGERAVGVRGFADGLDSVAGRFTANGGLAGRFEGDVHTTGRITKTYTSGTSSQAIPIAYAAVNSGGSVLPNASTPNVTATFDSVNKRYVITIADEAYDVNTYATMATPINGSAPRFISTQSSGGKLLVKIFDLTGAAVQNPFTFATFKP
jgi:hypothetical protein